MKVALVYDRVNKWGGAERVLLVLHELFPDAPLFTSVYSDKHAKWADVFPEIHKSFLQRVPFTQTRHELLPLFMPIAFESFNFDEYDLVISVTSEAAKGIITRGKTKHMCYCLTPTRYLWSGYEEYFESEKARRRIRSQLFTQLSQPTVWYLRKWDKIAAQRPDMMVGISREVQQRIQRYYDRESELVYPPIEIRIKNHESRIENKRGRSIYMDSRLRGNDEDADYFLIVSRLVPYKKVDLVVKTFNQMQLPLVIVGTGSQEKYLKRIAGPTIRFAGMVSEEELHSYYSNAKALIFPQEEDFGITAVEAQAHGVPVIAYKKGGALETVIHGKTGIFFEEQTKESLGKAIEQFGNLSFLRGNLINNARKFSKERFKKEFWEVVAKLRNAG